MTPRKIITADELRTLLDYCPETGVFVRRSGRYMGQVAGAFCSLGYRRIFVGTQTFYAHRLAWLYVHGTWPDELDHVNGIRSDNRICNLRPATHGQNGANKAARCAAGYKGVLFISRKRKPSTWRAAIRINGRSTTLGYFQSAEEAASAYEKAAINIHGDFARAKNLRLQAQPI